MTTISNYGNNYPSSNGYAQYAPNMNRENYGGGDPQQQRQYADSLNQPRGLQDQNAANPYYNNNFQYNHNTVSRSSQRNFSSDRLNRLGNNGSLEPDRGIPSNRNYPEDPQQGQYQGSQQENLQPSNQRIDDPSSRLNAIGNNYMGSYGRPAMQQNGPGGPVWGSNNFGENVNHNRIQKEYQEYVKNHDSNKLAYGGRPSANNNVGSYGEDKNRSPLRRRKDAGSTNQGDSWYIQNYNVGILPGMGNAPDGRRQAKMPTFEPTANQHRQIEQYDGRPGTYESHDMGQANPVGSRLAGIGSRLLDSDRLPYDAQRGGYQARPDQLRIPQEPQDYSSRNNGQNFQSPQYTLNRNHTQPALHTPQYNRVGYDNPGQGYRDDQRMSEKRSNQDAQGNGGRDIYGTNWLEERKRQEEDKKQKQKDELQKIYREQIEEKNRKKDEEKRRKFEEERREDERLRKENEDLNRQYLAEQQQKRQKGAPNVQSPQPIVAIDDYQKKPQKQIQQFETSVENPIRANTYDKPNGYENDPQIMRIEDVIKNSANTLVDQMKSNPRFELYSDPELNVHRAAMKKLDYTLDEQLEKMRRDLEVHSNMIKNQMSAYKTQAVVSQELRQNAQRDLMRLREELRNQQLQEEKRPYEGFEFTSNDATGKKQSEKVGLRIPMKNYTKMQGFEDEGEDLGASQGYNLDVETAYVAVRRADGDLPTLKETHGITGLMTKHGLKDDKASTLVNDAAIHKFDQLFPEHKNQTGPNTMRSEARVENSLRSMDKVLSSHSGAKHGGSEQHDSYSKGKGSRQNLGHDEDDNMHKLDGLLDTYQDKDEQSQPQSSTRKGGELPVRIEEKTQKHHSTSHIQEEIQDGEDGDEEYEYDQEEQKHT